MRTSRTPLSDFHNEPSVIPQRPTTFICPDSSQPPPFINPASRRRHAPPTPRVVYHVRWNRVSPAVNLGNGVTRGGTPGTLALISRRKRYTEEGGVGVGGRNDEGFQQEAARLGVHRPPAPLRTLNRRSGSAAKFIPSFKEQQIKRTPADYRVCGATLELGSQKTKQKIRNKEKCCF